MLTDPKTIYYSLTLPSPNQHSWCKIDLKITQPNTYTSINILLQLLPSRHCTDEVMLSFSAAHLINLALSHQQVFFFFYLFFFFKEFDSQHNKHLFSHATADFGNYIIIKWENEHHSGLKGNLRQTFEHKNRKKRTAFMHRILRWTLSVCETERVYL